MSVLVVDDNEIYLYLLKKTKKRINSKREFYFCKSIEEVKNLKSKRFSVGLIDFNIANDTAEDVFRLVEFDKAYVISALHSDETKKICLKLGAMPLNKQDIINIKQFKLLTEG